MRALRVLGIFLINFLSSKKNVVEVGVRNSLAGKGNNRTLNKANYQDALVLSYQLRM